LVQMYVSSKTGRWNHTWGKGESAISPETSQTPGLWGTETKNEERGENLLKLDPRPTPKVLIRMPNALSLGQRRNNKKGGRKGRKLKKKDRQGVGKKEKSRGFPLRKRGFLIFCNGQIGNKTRVTKKGVLGGFFFLRATRGGYKDFSGGGPGKTAPKEYMAGKRHTPKFPEPPEETPRKPKGDY